jgi:phage-related protein
MGRVIKFYHTASGRCPGEEFLDELDDRALAKVLAVFKLIETQDKGALVILTHGFSKKTPKTPDQEIKKAKRYMTDWEGRSQ